MARIPLVGATYTSRSLAASAQSCTNLIVEVIEPAVGVAIGVGTELQGKNKAALYGAPGRHLFLALSALNGNVRGAWSGEGRVFVVQQGTMGSGPLLIEVNESGAEVSPHNPATFTDPAGVYAAVDYGQPVPIFSLGGNQLVMIANGVTPAVPADEVNAGVVYCDNGSGPQMCRFLISGNVNVLDDVVTFVSGDAFVPGMGFQPILIDGAYYTTTGFNFVARANSHYYTAGTSITVADNPTFGLHFNCTTSGTSASSEPGGYATAVAGDSVTDGTAGAAVFYAMLAGVARANSTAYVAGQTIEVPDCPNLFFNCTTGGTTAASEPTGAGGYAEAIAGNSVTDGTAVFLAVAFNTFLISPSPALPTSTGLVGYYTPNPLPLAGLVDTLGTTCNYAGGDEFPQSLDGTAILIDVAGTPTPFNVTAWNNAYSVTLDQTPGGLIVAGAVTTSGSGYLTCTCVGGDQFPQALFPGGGSILINSGSSAAPNIVSYLVVADIGNSATQLKLATSPGLVTGAPYGVASISISGVLGAFSGATLTTGTGDGFPSGIAGSTVWVSFGLGTGPPRPYVVETWNSATSVTMTTIVGSYTGLSYSAGVVQNAAYTADGAAAPWGQVTTTAGGLVLWASGDPFPASIDGTSITIDNIGYTATYIGPYSLEAHFVDNGALYSASAGDPVTASSLTVLDNFAIIARPYSKIINISGLANGLSWDPLDFAQKEGYPDNIQALLADHEQLYLGGKEHSEIWQNTGNADFPFQRIQGAEVHYGMASTQCLNSLEGNVYFLGGDGSGGPVAYQLSASMPVRISTHALEQAWHSAGLVASAATSHTYQEEGHSFWVINFGAQAYCWDVTSQTWTRRQAWTAGAYAPYPTIGHIWVPEWTNAGAVNSGEVGVGKHLTWDGTNNLYFSSVNYYDDNGSDLHWERALPYVYSAGHQLYLDRLDLEMETGVAQTVEPSVNLDWSDDRGHTWGTGAGGVGVPLNVLCGLAGDYTHRIYWNQLGGTRGRVLRLSGTGQTKIALIDADLMMREGAH